MVDISQFPSFKLQWKNMGLCSTIRESEGGLSAVIEYKSLYMVISFGDLCF